jgi:hypothetical protein
LRALGTLKSHFQADGSFPDVWSTHHSLSHCLKVPEIIAIRCIFLFCFCGFCITLVLPQKIGIAV